MFSLAIVVVGLLVAGVAYWGYKPRTDGGLEGRRVAILLGALAVLYGLLFSGQWVPGSGDDAIYLSIARNVATTGDFVWNGSAVVIVPFGWPYVVAWVMKLSGAFTLLNLLPLGLVVVALVLWYFVLRKLTSASGALGLVLLTAVLFHWQRCAVHFYTEAMFFPFVPLGLLLAMQVGAGRPWGWRAPVLLAVCGAMLWLRFGGLLATPLLVAALLAGQPRRRFYRQWVLAVLVSAAMVGSFFGVRCALQWSAQRLVDRATERVRLAEAAMQKAAGVDSVALAEYLKALKFANLIVQNTHRDMAVEEHIVHRATSSGLQQRWQQGKSFGVWLSRLFWPPTEMGKTHRRVEQLCNYLGWVLLGLLLLTAWRAARQRQWMWAGLVVHCAAFVLIWPQPNGRYLAPVAPLLLLGFLKGFAGLISWVRRPWGRRALRVLAGLLLGSILVCNLLIYAGEVYVTQSPRFYSLALAGEHEELVAICQNLNRQGLDDLELAVGQDTGYKHILRMSNFLTNRAILTAPTAGRPNAATLEWAELNDVRYYLCRPPQTPRRLWHVRLQDGGTYLELYELRDGQAAKIEPPPPTRVDRVVGLESPRGADPSAF